LGRTGLRPEELLSLRDDILQGDLRLLYLVWLLGAASEGLGEMDTEEGAISTAAPPGLDQLSPALTAFINSWA
jgi:hypothetical protein